MPKLLRTRLRSRDRFCTELLNDCCRRPTAPPSISRAEALNTQLHRQLHRNTIACKAAYAEALSTTSTLLEASLGGTMLLRVGEEESRGEEVVFT
jgi:HPt (histidine-containing phosphotransfer) domain-containing protein